MKVLLGSLLIALLPMAAVAQTADETVTPDKGAPDVEVVKLEISVRRAPDLEASPVPRTDPTSIQQRQVDFNTPGPIGDSVGIANQSPRGRSPKPSVTDPTTPRYDRTGEINQSSDAYWPSDREDSKSPYNFYASLTIKNTGEKAIKNVSWDYVLTDPATQKEIKRYNFRGKKLMKSGESLTLKETVKPSGAARKVEIMRVEYADGSVWQRQ